MKNSRSALFWWYCVVSLGILLFLLAFWLISILLPASSIGRGYYQLGLLDADAGERRHNAGDDPGVPEVRRVLTYISDFAPEWRVQMRDVGAALF
jgi:hypothetical protein